MMAARKRDIDKQLQEQHRVSTDPNWPPASMLPAPTPLDGFSVCEQVVILEALARRRSNLIAQRLFNQLLDNPTLKAAWENRTI
jgi:hypothetical protein